MEELFDVCDARGHPTGRVEPRSVVHRQGLWHRSAHLWLLDGRDRVLLQRRHPGKETDPGRWDIAVAGHLSAGQTPEQAMVREAFEELGLVLSPDELTLVTQTRKEYLDPTLQDREFQSVFAVRRDVDLASLALQPAEVVGARWMDAGELLHRLQARDPSFVDRSGDWQQVFRFFGLFR